MAQALIYIAHFVSKLTDADAENAETQHWLHTASSCGYISQETSEELLESSLQIGRMLGKMINAPKVFCKVSE